MVESDAAIALMGNYEYNALAYAREIGEGIYLRSHDAKHTKQHEATLNQFLNHRQEWQSSLKWFYTLPLFLDLGNLRVVHACWDELHIEWLNRNKYFTMTDELLIASHNKGSKAYEVIEETLKGKEFNIPEKYAWADKDGHTRTANRYKWWVHPGLATYGDFLFNCPDSIKHEKVTEDLKVVVYPKEAPPVFFGHYWLEDHFPVIQSSNVICLDYSVAKGGALVAYRWNGEDEIDNRHFVSVR